MAFALDNVVPWGRSFDEYVRMFDLRDEDLSGRILGCGDGPASFNCRATANGARVVSVDPLYELSRDQIAARIDETLPTMMQQARENADQFVWTSIRSPEDLFERRMGAMREFLADFDLGKRQGRYVPLSLPKLPFASNSFDLALCSHLLFLYSEQLSLEFHIESILELSRLAGDVRVFPLVDLSSRPSGHVEPVRQALSTAGLVAEIRQVPYEFQRGGDRMLRVRA